MTAPKNASADAGSELAGLTWPPTGEAGRISLGDLLTALQLLGTDIDRKEAVNQTSWDAETPGSLQVLKSGVTSVTKWWLKRAGAAGGAAGLLAALGGVLISSVTPFRNALGEPIAVALVVAGALIIAATVLALAHFVTGDLRARAHATSARTNARANVATAFLSGSAIQNLTAPAADPDLRTELITAISSFEKLFVRVKGDPAWVEAVGLRRAAEGFQVRLESGDWKPVGEVEQYTTHRG